MRARQVCWLLGGAAILIFWHRGAVPLRAAPFGPGGFTNPTLIDFNAVPPSVFLGPSLPNPFAGEGVEFTGFVSPTVYPSPHSGNDLIPAVAGMDPLPGVVRADFLPAAGPVFRVGADVGLGFQAAGTLTAFDGRGAVIETVTGPISTTFPQSFFLGLETTTPIARVEFQQTPASGTTTTFPRIDNFRFEGQIVVVPEPTTFTLLVIGGTGLLGCAWRRRKGAVEGD